MRRQIRKKDILDIFLEYNLQSQEQIKNMDSEEISNVSMDNDFLKNTTLEQIH